MAWIKGPDYVYEDLRPLPARLKMMREIAAGDHYRAWGASQWKMYERAKSAGLITRDGRLKNGGREWLRRHDKSYTEPSAVRIARCVARLDAWVMVDSHWSIIERAERDLRAQYSLSDEEWEQACDLHEANLRRRAGA